ncbi:PorV/PorQ family protein [Candidatus Poribacteria bacterium]
MNRIEIALAVVTILAVCWGAAADTEYKYAGEFLNVGAGARALGMGGAFVAVADDGTTAYWSPGGLSSLQSREVAFMHSQQFDNLVKTNYIGYVHPTSHWGTFGISWLRLGVEDIPKTGYVDSNGNLKQDFVDENDNGAKDPGEMYIELPAVVGYFDDVEDGIFLSYGAQLSENFSAGANLKIIRQSMSAHSSSGYGIDIGALYQLFDGFKVGLNLQDVPRTRIKWDLTNHEDEIPFSVRAGAAYTGQIPSLMSIFTISFAVDTKYDTETHYGAEWWLVRTLALRLGLDEGELSAGCGLRVATFQVDYAFIGHDDLGSTHRISTSVQF